MSCFSIWAPKKNVYPSPLAPTPCASLWRCQAIPVILHRSRAIVTLSRENQNVLCFRREDLTGPNLLTYFSQLIITQIISSTTRTSRCTSWVLKSQRNQRLNFQHLLDHRKSKRTPAKIYFCLIDYVKAFNSVDHNELWKILKEMGTPVHLTCLLRNMYAGQEGRVRTRYGTMDWFGIGKGVHQGCILSPCLINLYVDYIMWNAGLDESQAGIKIAGEISTTPDMQMIWV